VAIQSFETSGSKASVFEFNKAHGTIGFGAVTETFIATLFTENGLEFVFASVHGEVTNVERVTRRVLISRVDWWI
jgi:hypothetical protein